MRNFNFILLLVAVFTVVGLSGCGPYPTEQAVEVKNNETAFVVPLEGDSKSKQAQFMSIEYLEKAKVATKRIVIPLRKRSLGRAWFDYEWIPLARVIVVDRSPVTREWLDKEGIKVESLDSVGFTVGVNCTGMIREEDAAKFLYYYPGNSLADVMNKNVKGFIQNVLAREFGSRDLSVCQKEKKNIVLDLAKELETHFAQYGITISNVGIADGMSYDNAEVQKTIDAVFVNETRVKQAEQEREAQKIINEKELSIAQNERLKAEEFAKAAEAQTKMVELKIRQMEAEARLRKFQCGILSLRSLCFFFGFSSLLILALLFTNTAVRVNGTNQADKSSRLFYRLNHKQSTDDANGKSADKRVGDITGESFKQIIKHDWEPLFNLMLVVCTFLAATTFSIYRLKMEFQLDKESRQNK